MYKTAIQPILTYGCSTIKLKPNDIDELEKVQASLIKAAVSLSKYSRNTPILRDLNIKKIGRILDERHLSLTRAALHNTSKSRTLYLHIMHKCALMHSIPPLHLYLYYLCFVVTVYRCYNPAIVQHTIALCPLSTPKPCVFYITFDLSKPYLRDCSFEISVSVLLTIIYHNGAAH